MKLKRLNQIKAELVAENRLIATPGEILELVDLAGKQLLDDDRNVLFKNIEHGIISHDDLRQFSKEDNPGLSVGYNPENIPVTSPGVKWESFDIEKFAADIRTVMDEMRAREYQGRLIAMRAMLYPIGVIVPKSLADKMPFFEWRESNLSFIGDMERVK